MFTGLVEHIGLVESINVTTQGATLVIADAAPILGDCSIGDSIAVDGVCLTVTVLCPSPNSSTSTTTTFTTQLAPETLRRSHLGSLKAGENVNLERALAVGDRFGGHVVQGHVDTTATIQSIEPDGDSLRFVFHLPPPSANDNNAQEQEQDSEEHEDIMDALVSKGFIAIDGISFTLTHVNDDDRTFSVMLIPHTQSTVVLARKTPGQRVNIEADILSKQVQRAISRALTKQKNKISS